MSESRLKYTEFSQLQKENLKKQVELQTKRIERIRERARTRTVESIRSEPTTRTQRTFGRKASQESLTQYQPMFKPNYVKPVNKKLQQVAVEFFRSLKNREDELILRK